MHGDKDFPKRLLWRRKIAAESLPYRGAVKQNKKLSLPATPPLVKQNC
jgi:hypothetical protein